MIREIIKVITGFVLICAQVILFVACIKTFLFEGYDPTDAIRTFVYVNAIAGALIVIRWILKPEYKWEPSPYNDFGTNCSMCYQEMSECLCHEDDYVPETHITEEMFNEAIDKIPYDDRNDGM